MSALATTLPVPAGVFIPVFTMGKFNIHYLWNPIYNNLHFKSHHCHTYMPHLVYIAHDIFLIILIVKFDGSHHDMIF